MRFVTKFNLLCDRSKYEVFIHGDNDRMFYDFPNTTDYNSILRAFKDGTQRQLVEGLHSELHRLRGDIDKKGGE